MYCIFYSFEGVETILYFVAINVFIRTLISQNYAYIQKYLKFSYLAKIDIIGSIIGGIIFYICIINHIGVESMVIGQIVNSFIVYLGVSFKNNSFFQKQ
ncbi:hypothetical protein CRG86_010140 [Photobacterium leiognathi]|nr:hypothetical protein CRG86_010140 [Photobacterium leiognathi]